jgi:hypothetical protein
MRTTLPLLVFAALPNVACDPILGVQGAVRSAPTAPPACERPATQEIGVPPPIAGAKITVRCNDRVVLETSSDDRGHFHNATVGFASESCRVTIEKPGFERFETALLEHCMTADGRVHAETGSPPCRAHLVVELVPTR